MKKFDVKPREEMTEEELKFELHCAWNIHSQCETQKGREIWERFALDVEAILKGKPNRKGYRSK